MAERVAEFMSLPGKILGSFAPANITNGLWIRCSLSIFQWDFGELLLLRHVTAKMAKSHEKSVLCHSISYRFMLLLGAQCTLSLPAWRKTVSHSPQRRRFHKRCGYNLTKFNTAINRTGSKASNPTNCFPLPCSCSEKGRHQIK